MVLQHWVGERVGTGLPAEHETLGLGTLCAGGLVPAGLHTLGKGPWKQGFMNLC